MTFKNAASYAVCTELNDELDSIKLELEDLKATLASKNIELKDLKSANDPKRAVIDKLKSDLAHAWDMKDKQSSQGWW